MSGRRSAIIVTAFAALALIVVPVFPHFVSPNEFTRWALAASLVEHHTTEVSQAAAVLGPRFEDLAVVDGRTYSNKAPGAALLGTIGYLAARPFTTSLRALADAMRLVASTLPLILLALLMMRLAKRFGRDDRTPLTIATLLFATPLMAYGLLLFAHALVAAALFAAWAFLFVEERPVLAGALIGIAVLSEYPALIPAIVMLAIAATARDWRRIGKVIAGGVPFAAALALYQSLCFGSVFRVSYTYEKLPAYRQVSHSGFYGIHFPSIVTIARFFFDPTFGLFVLSPILIVSLFALGPMRRAMPPRAFAAYVLSPLSTILVYAGYPNWEGGWSVGPRYILSIVPFLTFALFFARARWIEPLLLGFSAAATALVSLVFPFVPAGFALPWGTLSLPLLGEGLVAPNLLHAVGRAAAIAACLIPPAIALVVATGRRVWLAAIGIAIAIVAGVAAARSLPPLRRVERAYIADVYFEQHGALERSLPAGVSDRSPIFQRRELERTLPPASWPF